MANGNFRRRLKRLRDEILFPIIQFPLMATLVFATLFLFALMQFILLGLLFSLLMWLRHNGLETFAHAQIWSHFGPWAFSVIMIFAGSLLSMRYTWKIAKAKHPKLSPPHP